MSQIVTQASIKENEPLDRYITCRLDGPMFRKPDDDFAARIIKSYALKGAKDGK